LEVGDDVRTLIQTCSIKLNGDMVIFSAQKDVALLKSCSLTRIGDIPTTFHYGACNTFYDDNGSQYGLICFGNSRGNECLR